MNEFVEQGGLKKLFFLIEKNINVRTEALKVVKEILEYDKGLKAIASDNSFVDILYGLGMKDFCVDFFLSFSLDCLSFLHRITVVSITQTLFNH